MWWSHSAPFVLRKTLIESWIAWLGSSCCKRLRFLRIDIFLFFCLPSRQPQCGKFTEGHSCMETGVYISKLLLDNQPCNLWTKQFFSCVLFHRLMTFILAYSLSLHTTGHDLCVILCHPPQMVRHGRWRQRLSGVCSCKFGLLLILVKRWRERAYFGIFILNSHFWLAEGHMWKVWTLKSCVSMDAN